MSDGMMVPYHLQYVRCPMHTGKKCTPHKKTSGPKWGMRGVGKEAKIFYLFQPIQKDEQQAGSVRGKDSSLILVVRFESD